MNNEIMNIKGIDCYEENGVAYLKLETVARGLGFVEIAASGNECVRWRTVRKYLNELGIATSCDEKLPEYIPENIFYRLAMKAKNETAEKFQALIADEVIPQIRKTGGYQSKPLSPLELFAQSVAAMQAMEQKQKALEGRQDTVEKKVGAISDIVALNPNDWRRECKTMIVRIAEKLGGVSYIRDVNGDIYKLMLERFGIDLKRRLNNKRLRAAEDGMCRSKRDKLNYLDVVAEDKRAIESYVQIVKEMAIKYDVWDAAGQEA
jgi:prophage antirepressor-like protein